MKNILIGAICFSVWFVTLFFNESTIPFDKDVGLSMLLYIMPLISFILYIIRKNGKEENKKAKFLIIPITILSSTYFIYNNMFFRVANILVILILISTMILEMLNKKVLKEFKSLNKIVFIYFEALNSLEETFDKLIKYFREKLKINTSNEKKEKYKKIAKAICITAPLVFIILVLLSTADDIFGNIFINIFEGIASLFEGFMVYNLIIRIIITILVFGYLICFFYSICFKEDTKKEDNTTKVRKKDDFTIKIILICLNVIYLVFCTIQIKSLFMQNVEINYASYARKGFFQLMVVSVINLVTILIAKKSENVKDKRSNKYIKSMSLLMIIFTFIILISATIRMYNYENTYGYTLLRLLVYCILFTESILLIPTILFILDKKINLVKTYFYIVLVIYIGMNFANFDNLIAKRNVDRYFETGKIDIDYLRHNTSTDAINQIARIVENESSKDFKDVGIINIDDIFEYENNKDIVLTDTKRHLDYTYAQLNSREMDFRDFNLSKYFANKKLEDLKNKF